MNVDASGAVRIEVLAELQKLRHDVEHVEGGIVATTDGLLITHDLMTSATYGVEPEAVAALAAVNLGLSQRVIDNASHGDLAETVIRGSLGQVVTYPAGERALLTILVNTSGDIGLLHDRARRTAQRVADLVQNLDLKPWPDQPSWD